MKMFKFSYEIILNFMGVNEIYYKYIYKHSEWNRYLFSSNCKSGVIRHTNIVTHCYQQWKNLI